MKKNTISIVDRVHLDQINDRYSTFRYNFFKYFIFCGKFVVLCLTPNLKMSLLNKVWRISKIFGLTCKIWNDPFHFCVSDGTFSLFHHVVDEKDSPGCQLLLVSPSVVCYLTGQFWLSAASWGEPWPAIFCRTRGPSQKLWRYYARYLTDTTLGLIGQRLIGSSLSLT